MARSNYQINLHFRLDGLICNLKKLMFFKIISKICFINQWGHHTTHNLSNKMTEHCILSRLRICVSVSQRLIVLFLGHITQLSKNNNKKHCRKVDLNKMINWCINTWRDAFHSMSFMQQIKKMINKITRLNVCKIKTYLKRTENVHLSTNVAPLVPQTNGLETKKFLPYIMIACGSPT